MPALTALAYASQFLSILPQLIAAGVDATAQIQRARVKLDTFQAEGRDPTDAEWAELNATIEALRNELHAGEVPRQPV